MITGLSAVLIVCGVLFFTAGTADEPSAPGTADPRRPAP